MIRTISITRELNLPPPLLIPSSWPNCAAGEEKKLGELGKSRAKRADLKKQVFALETIK